MAVPLIIDTDPGVDDMLAILLACASPELDLRAVTTTYGNLGLPVTTRNAARLLALAGRHDVPVAAGAPRPLVFAQPGLAADIHGADGLGGRADGLPEPVRALATVGAVDMMASVLREASEPVSIAAIGPLTNVALLLATHPELTDRIGRIVVMGGAIKGGNTSAVAEFNIWCDPEAAARVLTDTVPVTMIGLDVTQAIGVDSAWLDDLATRGTVAATAAGITRAYNDHFAALGRRTFAIHDAVTITTLLSADLVATEPATVSVECGGGPARGCTVVDRKNPPTDRPPVQVGVSGDGDRIRALITDRLGLLG